MADFFADTYAIFAYAQDAKRYRPYFEDHKLVTTSLNLLEFAHGLLRGAAMQPAQVEALLAPLRPLTVEPDRSVVVPAAEFKRAMLRSGAHCSYVDAWGYATARWLGMPFLTGDEDFRKVPHVEFVKA